jgi:hypothetical protein
MFGDDPFIMPADLKSPPVAFHAWQYARQRCAPIAGSAATG